MTYEVELGSKAAKALMKAPKDSHARLVNSLEALRRDPRPAGVEKLTELKGAYRVRVGDWRVVFRIDDALEVVTVDSIARREKDSYRRFR